jgi:hypothetical protein
MQHILKTTGLLVGLTLLLGRCVEAYKADGPLNIDLLVVSGIITDQAGPQTIGLTRSVSRTRRDSAALTFPVTQASVEIMVDSTERLALTETTPGTYQLPAGFRGQIGHSYQLRFRTAEGVSYASNAETMGTVPPIARAYAVKHPGLVAVGDSISAATDVFVDYQDPPGAANFYRWRWRNYEVQPLCASCKQGRYVVRDIGPVGSGPLEVPGCVVDTSIRSFVYFDYPCRGQCWEIFYGTNLDIFTDRYTNGRPQLGHFIATIPAYQATPGLVVVEQLSLSANAYRYYKLLADQSQTNGTLADSPPAPTSGNVKNLSNPNENVIGYFSAAAVAQANVKFSRRDLGVTKYVGLLRATTNRLVSLEPDRLSPIFGGRPPSAVCVPGRTRTDQFPPGWND